MNTFNQEGLANLMTSKRLICLKIANQVCCILNIAIWLPYIIYFSITVFPVFNIVTFFIYAFIAAISFYAAWNFFFLREQDPKIILDKVSKYATLVKVVFWISTVLIIIALAISIVFSIGMIFCEGHGCDMAPYFILYLWISIIIEIPCLYFFMMFFYLYINEFQK